MASKKNAKARSAARKKRQSQQTNDNKIVIALVAVGIVGILGVLFMSSMTVTDSVDTAALVAEGGTDALMVEQPQRLSPQTYNEQFLADEIDHVLIDVRTVGEYSSGTIEGALNIPVESLAQRLSEVPTGKPVVLFCRSGNRSAQAARILEQAGFEGIYDMGGIIGWSNAGYPVQ